ncbi:MAG: hypothetical protein MJ053_06040 [Elusimicrobiaceae bacterium]|nr:hypothetical protein [Elusimicrobiaceae bacterium]
MSVAWDTVNLPLEKLYGVNRGYEDNAIITKFDSGRVIATQRNSKNKRKYALSYAATKQQKTIFFNWYENTLGGNAGTFTAPSLRGDGSTQEYMFVGTPTAPEHGGAIVEINMQWVEV